MGVRRVTNAALSLPLLFINAASAHTAPAPAESHNRPVCPGLYMKWQWDTASLPTPNFSHSLDRNEPLGTQDAASAL